MGIKILQTESHEGETGHLWHKHRIHGVAIFRIMSETEAIAKKLHNRIKILQIHLLVQQRHDM
jgi:hypothetical protein